MSVDSLIIISWTEKSIKETKNISETRLFIKDLNTPKAFLGIPIKHSRTVHKCS